MWPCHEALEAEVLLSVHGGALRNGVDLGLLHSAAAGGAGRAAGAGVSAWVGHEEPGRYTSVSLERRPAWFVTLSRVGVSEDKEVNTREAEWEGDGAGDTWHVGTTRSPVKSTPGNIAAASAACRFGHSAGRGRDDSGF
jgi:hypothetical protein